MCNGSGDIEDLFTRPMPSAVVGKTSEQAGDIGCGEGGGVGDRSRAGGCGPRKTMTEAAANRRSSMDATTSPARGPRSIEGRSGRGTAHGCGNKSWSYSWERGRREGGDSSKGGSKGVGSVA